MWEVLILDLAGWALRYGRESVGNDYVCACDAAGQFIPRCYWDRQELMELGERAPDLVLGALVPIGDPARVVEALERVLAVPPTPLAELVCPEGESA